MRPTPRAGFAAHSAVRPIAAASRLAALRACLGASCAFRSGTALAALAALVFFLTAPLASAQDATSGTISGRVFDAGSGAPIEGATVILQFPDPGDGSEPRQAIATSGPAGDYEFGAVPAGRYDLSFIKSGFRASSAKGFEVVAGQDNVQNFPMPPAQAVTTAGGDVLELDEYVVEASVVDELMDGLELRMESDLQVNLLSAEDLSKYAASDVADALKRVAGVNIVEGQFAIIRGLEDRYSSTMFNGAPVPSPDPNRQSVQLDLFPSDVVSNLVVAKTFEPASPSNSSGGSIDIVTDGYPDDLTVKFTLGGGFEEEAKERFLEFQSGSRVGKESDPVDIIESDVGGSVGGRTELWNREIRYKAVVNHEIDYRTEQGFIEGREPFPEVPGVTSGLSRGELNLSDGRFEQTQSTREEQLTWFGGLGIDLDEPGAHRIDASYFHTEKAEETVDLRENGFIPGLDYGPLIDATVNDELNPGVINSVFRTTVTPGSALRKVRDQLSDGPARGVAWFANFGRSSSFERNRDLDVYQLNGSHEFDLLEGLDFKWATNYATSTQDDRSLGMRFVFEPCGLGIACPNGVAPPTIPPTRFPVRVSDLTPGTFLATGGQGGIVNARNDIQEEQFFARFDLEQAISLHEQVELNLKAGFWWEQSDRDVESRFVETTRANNTSEWVFGAPTLERLGSTLSAFLEQGNGTRDTENQSSREITAGHANAKLTVFEDVDLFGGVRLEQISIESKNDPFTGEPTLGGRPGIFPTAYLFFDRLDTNPEGFASPPFNDQILGIDVPIDPDTGVVDLLTWEQILALVNGEIDETKLLPSAGITYRPIEGVTLRAAYSQTVARPSFREVGYYVTVEPGTDEQTVGNPQLGISEVESYDARAEYVFGDFGDLVAFSAFYKVIDDPIESTFVRNPLNRESGAQGLFRTFFNNQNTARLWGVEVEARKTLDFFEWIGLDFPGSEILESFSIGGNYSYIEASVDRSSFEIERVQRFFTVAPGDRARFDGLKRERRLFGQPEWIANADVTFDREEWGTSVTLAIFAISDVLDTAGAAGVSQDLRTVQEFILDRYLDSYYQLDLVASQEIWQGLTVKMSVKNLTNTARRRIYDPEQTSSKIVERSRRSGRDWSFSVGYKVDF